MDKQPLRLGGLLLAALLSPFFALATHIIGGEMTYKYLSTNATTGAKTFEFTLTVYKDCSAGVTTDLDANAPIGIYRGSAAGGTLIDNFTVPIGSKDVVVPFIPPCTDPNATNGTCAQRGVYTFTRELPVPTNGQSYFVIYQRCCRTAAITNVNNPNQHGATYVVEITAAAFAGNNSSPSFKNYPPTFICADFHIAFDHSAIDVDGDSLVYVFCNSLDGGGQGGGGGGGGNGCGSPTPNPPCGPPFSLIPFSTGYTAAVPMAGNPIITIDSTTGFLDGIPNILGKFVVGICVLEYRNGVLIGSVLRDFQFNVLDCTPTVSAIIAADSTISPKDFYVERCGQNPVKIINKSVSTPDLQTYLWQFDLGNGLTYSASTANVSVPLPGWGTYHGLLYLNKGLNCPDSAKVTLVAHPGSEAKFSYEFDSCQLTPVVFHDSSTTGAAALVKWDWTFYDPNSTSTVPSPVHDFKNQAPGTYLTRLIVTDTDDCRDTASVQVGWVPKPLPPFTPLPPVTMCQPAPAVFGQLYDPATAAGLKFLWDFGDQTTGNKPFPVHTYPAAGSYPVKVVIKGAYHCKDSTTTTVTSLPVVTAQFSYDFDSCHLTPVQFTDLSKTDAAGGLTNWDWTFFDPNSTSTEQDPVHFFNQTPGIYPTSLIVTDVNGCRDTTSQQVGWATNTLPTIPPMTPIELCLPATAVFDSLFDVTTSAGLKFTWDFGDGTTSNDPYPRHPYIAPGDYNISVLIEGLYHCQAADTFPALVTTNAKPTASFEFSPKFGISNLKPHVQFTNTSDPSVTHWDYDFSGYGSTGEPSPAFDFPDTGKMTVQLIVATATGCRDTTVQQLDVVPMIRLYFPNVFNPVNSIGVDNDHFKPVGVLPGYSDYEMQIFSRWGELVFRSSDPTEAWDGRRRGGKLMQPGVFTWYMHMKGPRGEPYEFEGTVTIVE